MRSQRADPHMTSCSFGTFGRAWSLFTTLYIVSMETVPTCAYVSQPIIPLRSLLRSTTAIHPSELIASATDHQRGNHLPRRHHGRAYRLANSNDGNDHITQMPYVRIQKRGRHFDIQTAITTFRKDDRPPAALSQQEAGQPVSFPVETTVDLHAQIHFGDSSYFDFFNSKSFDSQYDRVLYELIVEDKLLASSSKISTKPSSNLRTLAPIPGYVNPMAPTPSDRNTASQYGLQCQLDGIAYCRPNWIHADLTREEFLSWMENGPPSPSPQSPTQRHNPQISHNQPLWSLASTTTYPGSEVFTALLRPLSTNSASAILSRRLFTHLFLPGNALSGWIRAALWCGVPNPELSIMLVDWSSLSYGSRRLRRWDAGAGGKINGASASRDTNDIGPISPIAAPVLLSLLTGNWGTARRLVFGQVLVGGQSNSDTSKNGVLIQARNTRAIEVLDECTTDRENEGAQRIALLYGAAHCRDLHRRLQNQGYVQGKTQWRTAFRVTVPEWGDFFESGNAESARRESSLSGASSAPTVTAMGEGITKYMSVSSLESIAVGLVILPLYLLIGGLDWVSTIGDLGTALSGGSFVDGAAAVILYLLRHVALYVGISKFVVNWGGNDGVFEEENGA